MGISSAQMINLVSRAVATAIWKRPTGTIVLTKSVREYGIWDSQIITALSQTALGDFRSVRYEEVISGQAQEALPREGFARLVLADSLPNPAAFFDLDMPWYNQSFSVDRSIWRLRPTKESLALIQQIANFDVEPNVWQDGKVIKLSQWPWPRFASVVTV